MKKIITIGLILCFMFSLVGCESISNNNTENLMLGDTETQAGTETEEARIMKEVVFFNYIDMVPTTGINDGWSELEYQTIIGYKHPYDYKQEDTLFAIGFSLGRYKEDADSELPSDYPIRGENEDEDIFNKRLNEYLDGKGIELLKSEGIYTVVYDNPNDSSVIIVATPKELNRLFASDDSVFNDWTYSIYPEVRLDFMDIVKELGWKEENRDLYEWCQDNLELVQSKIGEEPHVTMTVEVEKP